MDPNIEWFQQQRGRAVVRALAANRMSGELLAGAEQAPQRVLELIPPGSTVALGGSMTLFETGVVEALRASKELELIDRFQPGLEPDQVGDRLRRGLTADVFVAGANAVTEAGELVFVDSACTRVAPVLFGPGRVILVAGANKIVPDLSYAQKRIRHFVAPANAKRLGRKTPCAADGRCHDCDSPERICNATVVIHKQAQEGRLFLLLVPGSYGL
jgi:hypothetical protein